MTSKLYFISTQLGKFRFICFVWEILFIWTMWQILFFVAVKESEYELSYENTVELYYNFAM